MTEGRKGNDWDTIRKDADVNISEVVHRKVGKGVLATRLIGTEGTGMGECELAKQEK